ncbi:hypothetical protein JST97_37345 [bacterium]|nr:hypothetical protein [bacterium]
MNDRNRSRQASPDPQLLREVQRELNREAIRLVLERCQNSQRELSTLIDAGKAIVSSALGED